MTSVRSIPATASPLRATRLVTALAAITLLQWLAASSTLPLLPVWLGDQGASDLVIGLAMGAFFVGALAAQYPLGRRSDRSAPTRLLLAGVVGYALAGAAFLLPLHPGAVVGLRAVQGAAAGATEVLALALVGRCVPAGQRARGYGAVFAAQTAGLAIGPLLAGVAGVEHMNLLFAIAAGVGLAALGPWRLLPTTVPTPAPAEHRVARRRLEALRPVIAAAAVAGLVTGVYESCWTLLLDQHGASGWQIGLSWTMFCIPFIAASTLVSVITNRVTPRRIALTTLACSIALLATYPLISSIPVIIALGAVEGAATALAYPAAQLLLAQGTPSGQLGRAQGTVATVQTAATAGAAVAGGALFGITAWLPFVVVAATCAGLLAAGFRPRASGR
jgi:DHA1 family multidrug resistance protein-like MFS transporter